MRGNILTKTGNIIALFTASLFLMAALGGPVANKVREGNNLYKLNKYTEALDAYNAAQSLNPENPAIQFNIGDALFQQKK